MACSTLKDRRIFEQVYSIFFMHFSVTIFYYVVTVNYTKGVLKSAVCTHDTL